MYPINDGEKLNKWCNDALRGSTNRTIPSVDTVVSVRVRTSVRSKPPSCRRRCRPSVLPISYQCFCSRGCGGYVFAAVKGRNYVTLMGGKLVVLTRNETRFGSGNKSHVLPTRSHPWSFRCDMVNVMKANARARFLETRCNTLQWRKFYWQNMLVALQTAIHFFYITM